MATVYSVILGIERNLPRLPRLSLEPRLTSVFDSLNTKLGVIDTIKLGAASMANFRAQAGEVELAVEEMIRRNEAFQKLVVAMNWPPPSHSPVTLIDAVTESHARGELTREDVAALFVECYDAELIGHLLSEWKKCGWLQARTPILEEGIRNHLEGRYYSAVYTLLPQIEGVVGDDLGRQPVPKSDAMRFFSDSRLSKVARDFYVNVILEGFNWQATAPIPELSRHAILHGCATSFGSAEHSLKVILMLDAVIAATKERQGQSVV